MALRILAAIGKPELAEDARFANNAARLEHVEALDQEIGDFIKERTLEANLAHFAAHDVTVGPVLSVDQLMQDPHIVQRQSLIDIADPELGSLAMHNVFPRLSKTPGRIRIPSPTLGQHQELATHMSKEERGDNHEEQSH